MIAVREKIESDRTVGRKQSGHQSREIIVGKRRARKIDIPDPKHALIFPTLDPTSEPADFCQGLPAHETMVHEEATEEETRYHQHGGKQVSGTGGVCASRIFDFAPTIFNPHASGENRPRTVPGCSERGVLGGIVVCPVS